MPHGKIARLPGEVREQLNRRLDDGAEGLAILEWLNGLPEVQLVLKNGFAGTPINMPNLTAWRQGGFREWQIRGELFDQATGMAEMGRAVDTPSLTRDLVATLAAHYAGLMARWDGTVDKEFNARARALGRLTRELDTIQRVATEPGAAPIKVN